MQRAQRAYKEASIGFKGIPPGLEHAVSGIGEVACRTLRDEIDIKIIHFAREPVGEGMCDARDCGQEGTRAFSVRVKQKKDYAMALSCGNAQKNDVQGCASGSRTKPSLTPRSAPSS